MMFAFILIQTSLIFSQWDADEKRTFREWCVSKMGPVENKDIACACISIELQRRAPNYDDARRQWQAFKRTLVRNDDDSPIDRCLIIKFGRQAF